MRKAQGLSFNVIIIAVLGIIVMIVLVMIFSGRMNILHRSTTCSAKQGVCMSPAGFGQQGECPPDKPIVIMTEDCTMIGGPNAGTRPGQCCIAIR
jgi:hypothetical protein